MTGAMVLFDTSIVIDMLRGRRDFSLGSISVITVFELLRGVRDDKRSEVKSMLENSFDVIGMDNRVVLTYCELYSALRKAGRPVEDADLIIAATAKAYGEKLQTKDKDLILFRDYGVDVELLE